MRSQKYLDYYFEYNCTRKQWENLALHWKKNQREQTIQTKDINMVLSVSWKPDVIEQNCFQICNQHENCIRKSKHRARCLWRVYRCNYIILVHGSRAYGILCFQKNNVTEKILYYCSYQLRRFAEMASYPYTGSDRGGYSTNWTFRRRRCVLGRNVYFGSNTNDSRRKIVTD